MTSVLILVSLIVAAIAAKASYKGHKVFQIYPKDERELKILEVLNNGRFYDFWSIPRSIERPSTVMVSQNHEKAFNQVLKRNNIKYSVLIDNVKRSISAEQKRQRASRKRSGRAISFDAYYRYDQIQDYLLKLEKDYPDTVSVENIGTSYENRTMRMIKIGSENSSKPVILVDGGIHSREWISPAFVTYLIHELVENENNRYMTETTNWYLIPVLNPDGYEFTHTDNRFWRKTRSIGERCNGVDGNRNFGYHWQEKGGSPNECRTNYAGPTPFSEPEMAALRDVVNSYKKQIKLYLSFHSYGNYILYPWGYTEDPPDDADELYRLATAVNSSIAAVAGTGYEIGGSMSLLYAAAGESIDWVKGVGGVELSYTLELTGGGKKGFDLPGSEILNVCNETFEGVKVFHEYIEQKFNKK